MLASCFQAFCSLTGWVDTCHNLLIPLSLQWLKEEFLPYLERWQKSAQEREGFSDAEVEKMQLSDETLLGLRMTGVILCW